MYSKVFSFVLDGLDVRMLSVESDMVSGLPSLSIVGLWDAAVLESRERLRSALRNSGFPILPKRITVNLAPADTRKRWPYLDLPIAISVLFCQWTLSSGIAVTDCIFVGEAGLSWEIRSVTGILPLALKASELWKIFVCPLANVPEIQFVRWLKYRPVSTIAECIAYLRSAENHVSDHLRADRFLDTNIPSDANSPNDWFASIIGQFHAKRALAIAATGRHNILLEWPPWSGKTRLAKAIHTIVPALSDAESLEVSRIHSIAWLLSGDRPYVRDRPVRTVHPGITTTALLGGWSDPRPGEISLAHHGILILDEFSEYGSGLLESLRQPLEDGKIALSRMRKRVEYPAEFLLVATMNPCPCGFAGIPEKCVCSPNEVSRYRRRISGPIRDRIDMNIRVPLLQSRDYDESNGEVDTDFSAWVSRSRQFQSDRLARLLPSAVSDESTLLPSAKSLLRSAVDTIGLSGRWYFRVLRLARTIADFSASDSIRDEDILESLSYRSSE